MSLYMSGCGHKVLGTLFVFAIELMKLFIGRYIIYINEYILRV